MELSIRWTMEHYARVLFFLMKKSQEQKSTFSWISFGALAYCPARRGQQARNLTVSRDGGHRQQ